MKNFIAAIVLATLTIAASAQDDPAVLTSNLSLNIQNTSTSIDGQSAQGFSVYIESPYKSVNKGFKKYWKGQYNFKAKKSGGMMKAEGVEMFDIWSSNTVTFYYNVKGSGSGSEVSVFVYLGGTFLDPSKHADAADNLKSKLRTFVKSHYTEELNDILKDETKAQKKENKALAKLEKQKRTEEKLVIKAEKKVAKANKAIDKANAQIRKAEAEIEKSKGEITENEELGETTKEKIKVTESEIKQQLELVGGQNQRVDKVQGQLDVVRGL